MELRGRANIKALKDFTNNACGGKFVDKFVETIRETIVVYIKTK